MTWILVLSFGLFFGAIIGLVDAFGKKLVQNPRWEALPRFLTLGVLLFTLAFLNELLYPHFQVVPSLLTLAATLFMIASSATFVNILVNPNKS